jgi:hypothetical protein
MKRRGHPILGGIAGLLFGLFLDLFLVTATVVSLDSILLTILPIALLVLGVVWGIAAPLGRSPSDPTAV